MSLLRNSATILFALVAVLAAWMNRGADLSLQKEYRAQQLDHVGGEPGTCRDNPLGVAEKLAIKGFPYICGWQFVSSGRDGQVEVFAYTQPPGILAWANSAIVVDHDEKKTVLVDVFQDVDTTKEMLDGIANITAVAPISHAIVTHADSDHFFGLEALPKDTSIVSSEITKGEIQNARDGDIVKTFKQISVAGTLVTAMLEVLKKIPYVGESHVYPNVAGLLDKVKVLDTTFARMARFGFHCLSGFRIGNVTKIVVPDAGFENAWFQKKLIQIHSFEGHSSSDIAVFVKEAGVVIAGDLLFGLTPIAKVDAAKIQLALETMLSDQEMKLFVPGHGPIMDRAGVMNQLIYWKFLRSFAKKCYEDEDSFGACAEKIALALPDDSYPTHTRINLRVEYERLKGNKVGNDNMFFLDEVGRKLHVDSLKEK